MSTSRIGRYEILRPLGRGAMGLVYLARDPQIEREVALKTVRFDGPGTTFNVDESKARFLKEARIAGRLQHPHIVTVFDVGEDAGTLYLAMEYVAGGSLSQRLGKGTPLDLEDRIRIVCEVAAALAHAHERGVIHRDIKPANILLSESLAAKVTDFGIGKLIVGDTDLTSTGQMVGSPSYMSPEQIRGEKLDVRSDIFSLGVVLYQTLTERKPFPADTLTTLVYQILHEEPPDPNVLRNNLPPGISPIVRKCLAKNRDDRYSNAGELADELAAVLGLPVDGGTVGLSESVVRKRRTSSTHPPTTPPTPIAPPKAAEPAHTQEMPTMPSAERPVPTVPEPPPGASAPDETLVSESHGGSPPPTIPPPPGTEASASGARPVSRSGAAPAPRSASPSPARGGAAAPPAKRGGKGPVIAIAAVVAIVLGFFALRGKKTAVEPPPPTPAAARTVVPSPAATPQPVPTLVPAVVESPTAPAPEPTAEPTKKGVAKPRATATAVAKSTATPAPATATPIPVLGYASRRFVKLDITPNQARVFLDGRLIGIADDWDDNGGGAILAFLKEGKHRLRIAYPEHRDVIVDLAIGPSAPNDTVTIKGALEKGTSDLGTGAAPTLKRPEYRTIGAIRFNVEPKDAVVEVDGFYRGPVAAYTSQDLQVAEMGVFDVKISAPGYETRIVRVLFAPSAGEARAVIKEKLKSAAK